MLKRYRVLATRVSCCIPPHTASELRRRWSHIPTLPDGFLLTPTAVICRRPNRQRRCWPLGSEGFTADNFRDTVPQLGENCFRGSSYLHKSPVCAGSYDAISLSTGIQRCCCHYRRRHRPGFRIPSFGRRLAASPRDHRGRVQGGVWCIEIETAYRSS